MVAAAMVATAVVGAAVSSDASRKSANTQADAARNANQLAQNQNDTMRSDLAPYVQGGYGAQSRLNNLLGIGSPTDQTTYGQLTRGFTAQDYLNNQDPGYQFQLQQGQQALQNSQAAQGGVLSGAALKDLIKFNQGVASTGYTDAFNRFQTQNQNTYARLAGLLQVGEAGAAQQGVTGANLANTSTNALMSQGNALAAGQVGQANAISGGLNSAAGYYYLNNMGKANTGGTFTGNTGLEGMSPDELSQFYGG
jgi:hypothetical protein